MTPRPLHVTVVVTLLNDARVARTLASLAVQSRRPDLVLVADGGSDARTLAAVASQAKDWIRLAHLPGSVAETRNAAIRMLGEEPAPEARERVVVFLDSDQVAPSGWLARLVTPIEKGEADFAGGPTKPLGPPSGPGEAYLNAFEAWFYPHVVAHDLTKLPMGNSAWRLDAILAIGGFDPRLTWGGEDYDVNLRAASAGLVGAYVEDAWVHHDQGGRNDLRRLLRRKYRYNVGATMAYMKNGVLREKMRAAARNTVAFRHPYERWNVIIQPLALLRALTMARRLR